MNSRSVMIVTALLAPATSAWAGPHRASPPPRVVQLISMSMPAPTAAEPMAEPESEPPADVGPSLPAAFQVHDLSRRWVEFQMAQRLRAAAPPGAREAGSEDPFARQEKAAVAAPTPFSPTSALAIPEWMRSTAGAVPLTPAFAPGCDPRPYRPAGFLRSDAETRRQTYYGMMSRIACEYGLPVGLFDAMIIRESRYDPVIVSPKNAFGLTQLMPATASGLGVNRYDVLQNLRGGASYLRQQLDRFGQFHLALAAYNAGPGRVRGAVPAIAETRAYVDDILRNWSRLSGFEQSAAARELTGQVALERASFGRSATLLAFR